MPFLFSQPQSTAIGDPYKDASSRDKSRIHHIKGVAQFKTAPSPKGQSFEVNRLFDGELYVSSAQRKMRERKKNREKNLVDKAFYPTSPPKKISSHSSYEEPIEYPPKKDDTLKASKSLKGRKQILTNPPKKGHYNTPGILLSDIKEADGGTNKIGYLAADYGSFERQERARRKAYTEANADKKGWRPAGMRDKRAHPDNDIFVRDDKCLPKRPDPYNGMSSRERVVAKKPLDPYERKAFCSTGKEEKGITAGFGKFPEYIAQPDDENKTAPRGEEEEDRKPFKPASKSGTGPVRSIARMAISKQNRFSRRR